MRKMIFVLPLLMILVAGCASLGLKPYSEMTPQEKSLFFLKQYNSQYDNTMTQAKNPNLNAAQKGIVNQKRTILIKMKPYVEVYLSTVMSGGTPSADTEAQILNLIDQLAALGSGV